MKTVFSVGCAICGSEVATTSAAASFEDVAKCLNLSLIKIESKKKGNQKGVLCRNCESVFSNPAGLEKMIRTAVKSGNGSGVTLPVSWRGKRVFIFKMDD